MPITSSWLIENKVIINTYQGIIDTDDLRQVADDIVSMIDTSDSPLVHTLIDIQQLERYPINVVQIIQSARKLLTHPRYGWLIVFGNPDEAMGFILHTITSAMRVRTRLFETIDEALAFLETMDSSINSAPRSEEDNNRGS